MEKPTPENFGLTEAQIPKIEAFNREQDKLSWHATHCFSIIAIVILGLLGLAVAPGYFWIGILIYIPPFLLFLIYSIIKESFFPNHSLTNNIKSYRDKLNDFENYQKKLKEDYWFGLSGYQFEAEITKLIKPFFKEVILTKGSGDGGVDIIIRDYHDCISIVQCKAHKKPIGPEPVRALIGVMDGFSATKAIFIALGGFTKGAKEVTGRHRLYFMDISDVIMMAEAVASNELSFAGLKINISI